MFLYQSNRFDPLPKVTYSSFVFKGGVTGVVALKQHCDWIKYSIASFVVDQNGENIDAYAKIYRGNFTLYIHISPEEPDFNSLEEFVTLVGDRYETNTCSFGTFIRFWDHKSGTGVDRRTDLWRIVSETDLVQYVSVRLIFADVYR